MILHRLLGGEQPSNTHREIGCLCRRISSSIATDMCLMVLVCLGWRDDRLDLPGAGTPVTPVEVLPRNQRVVARCQPSTPRLPSAQCISLSHCFQNLVDGVDVPLSLTRSELATLCEGELGKIKTLVRGCLEEAATDAGYLAGAQAFGGGCRMPIVQEAIREEVRRTAARRRTRE